jgi:hypothetical protein
MLYIYLHEATVVGLMKRVIRNQWYWSYRVLVKENRGVWDSLYVNGSLTRCDSWNSNLESNLRWAVSSNDVIYNWRVSGSPEEHVGVLAKYIIEELTNKQKDELLRVMAVTSSVVLIVGGVFLLILLGYEAVTKFDWDNWSH